MTSNKRKKRIIEIYFILYLAALVFILPENTFRPGTGNNKEVLGDFASGFTLIPEKTSLACKVAIEPNGQRILSIDSVNTIFYTGDFEDVQFEFILEDQTLKQAISLRPEKTQLSKYFRIVEVPERKSAVFYWHPQLLERTSNTYIVRVNATAKSHRIFGKNNPEQFTYQASTQFSLIIVYMNTITGEQTLAQNQAQNPITQNLVDLSQLPKSFGKIDLRPNFSNISSLAYQQWTNIVYASNVDLATGAKVQLNVLLEPRNNGGEAQIAETHPDYIVIRGRTPGFGKLTAEVFVKRNFDGQEMRSSFNVTPQQIELPKFKRVLYPGQTDTIEPRLPLIAGEVKTIIREGNTIRASSIGGALLYFTPELADTGKKLTLERFVNGNLYGQAFDIFVLNFPEPKIYDVITSNREVEVVTQAFGSYNRQRNEIERLELEGNVSQKYLDLRGKIQDINTSPASRLQHFLLKPTDLSKPFTFTIVAVDKFGKKSLPRRIVAD
ncbi:MAG: hypothetical protein ACUVQ1_07865 [Candidatus Kapaibacteriales bacterium]